MAFFDKWSWLFAVLGIVELVLLLLSKSKKEDQDDEETEEA